MSERSCLVEKDIDGKPTFVPCTPSEECFCFPNDPNDPEMDCTLNDTTCPDGEVCANTPIVATPICASSDLVASDPAFEAIQNPSPSDEEDAICIDVSLLRHLRPHQLVFARHGRARVLCDPDGSCATPGHMVVWRARAMMMATYCAAVRERQCREEVRWVNSPKWARKARVASRTSGLEFTAFAARYATRVEEAVLRMAVHVGL